MHNQCDVGVAYRGCMLPKPLRHVGIESGDEWNARRAAEPGRGDSAMERLSKRAKPGDDPGDADFVAMC